MMNPSTLPLLSIAREERLRKLLQKIKSNWPEKIVKKCELVNSISEIQLEGGFTKTDHMNPTKATVPVFTLII